MPTSRLRVAALIGLIGLPLGAATQERPAGTFGGTVDVRVVNVEAVVTDAAGNRRSGLGPGAFRLLVDGQPVAIDYFSEVRDGALAPAAGAGQGAVPPPALSGQGPTAAMATSYLVFVDEYFPLQSDRNRSLSSVAELVGSLGPRDSMAVVAWDGNGLTKLADWTVSRDTLLAVVGDAAERPAGGYLRRFEVQDTGTDVELRNYVRRLKEQTQAAVAAATSALRAVRPPEGRKVMILLSGGWPMDPSYLLPASDYRYAERRNLGGGPELFRPLTDTANLLGYTLYPLDVPGLQGRWGDESSERGFDLDAATALRLRFPGGGGTPGGGDTPGGEPPTSEERHLHPSDTQSLQVEAPPVREDQRELEDQYALQHLAAETGGVAMVNAPLARMADDTRTFYWLGFSPPVKGDDARHEVRVEVVEPGLEVRARRSYVDFSPATMTSMRVESALLAGGAEGDASLKVEVGATARGERRTVLVPLTITIPTDEVTALEAADGFRIELELRAAALDEWGRPSAIPVVPVVFTSPRPPAPGGFATYRTTVRLRRGASDLLVTVYDPRLDRLLAKRVRVEG